MPVPSSVCVVTGAAGGNGTPDPWVGVRWAVPDPAAVTDPLLDAAERAHCERFRLVKDRARHATARVLAKRYAASVHGVTANRVRVVADTGESAGRPLLVIEGVERPVHLSISHAGDAVVVALANTPVGVDVEQVAPMASVIDSDLIWCASELARLAAEPAQSRLELACCGWTGKEAALKAIGRGIVDDLTAVPAGVEAMTLVSLGRTHHLHLRQLEAPRDYRATLALVHRTDPSAPTRAR